MLRLLRGAIGMGLTWALAWFGAGMIVGVIVDPGADDVPLPIRLAILGFLSGVTFSGVLGLVGGRRRFDEMSLGRFTAWGAVGGLVLSGILAATAGPGGQSLVLVPILTLAGAGSAAGTLAMARRAEPPKLRGADSQVVPTDDTTGQLR